MHAIEEVFHDLKGADVPVPHISAGGRTDNFICQQLLYKASGVMPTDEEVDDFCRKYEQKLLKWLKRKKEDGVIFKGVIPILERFAAADDYVQLLLTGNSAIGARLKLECFGLSQYFDFDHSGFACHYYYRNDLALHARELAQAAWGDAVTDMYVIGDTPYDIQCGKAIGAKTISISTGHYTFEELAASEPWKQFHKLPDVATFEKIVK